MIRIADDIYTWRRTYRITQADAAFILGVSVRTLGRWERGESSPNEDHYNSIRWLIAQPPAGWVRS